MSKLIYVSSSHGDWCATYIDGKLEDEGHSIAVWQWLEYVTVGVTETEDLEVDGEWLEEGGSFPNNFEEIPKDKFI